MTHPKSQMPLTRADRPMSGRIASVLLISLSTQLSGFGTSVACNEPSLRAAVEQGGLIQFGCDATIRLSKPLSITKDTILDATGHRVVLSGDDQVRIFEVAAGTSLNLTNLILTQGYAIGGTNNQVPEVGDAAGGAILSLGRSLVAVDCAFTSNRVVGARGFIAPNAETFPRAERGGHAVGGAVSAYAGSVRFERCLFQGNQTQGGLGGTYQDGDQINDSTSPGGNAAGGALHSTATELTLRDCQLLANQASPGYGGQLSSIGNRFSNATGLGSGGAIYSASGVSHIEGCTFQSNRLLIPGSRYGGPYAGGGIYNLQGRMTIHDTTLSGNQVYGSLGNLSMGGAIYNGGRLDLRHCQLQTNLTRGAGTDSSGGALFNAGQCTIESSTFHENAAQGEYWFYSARLTFPGQAKGGAIYNAGSLDLLSSSFVRNTSGIGNVNTSVGEAFGGAVYNTGWYRGTNATFFENATHPSGTLGGFGGAIFNQGTTTLAHATLAANRVLAAIPKGNYTGRGGGIFSTNGTVTLLNSLLKHGSSGSNCFGALTDAGGNLSSDASCHFANGLNSIDPLLGPLKTYENGVPLLVLLSGSPAIDAALPESSPASDARGASRPFGPKPDIGAFESHGEFAPNTLWVDRLSSGEIQISHYSPTKQPRVLEFSSDQQTWNNEPPGTASRDLVSSWRVPIHAGDFTRWFRVRWQ
ncbi:MAG: hypothetical protein JNN07_07960 [Verrucomicrobiales bacterium]|nr:hypothetical protein [Verrucomicrobiales bacterium]